jgi:tryptophan synthase alpha chain
VSRIEKKFAELRRRREKALILFITAGDPDFRRNEELVLAFEKEGVDFVELGIPFSDPLADGPVIQASSMRSLAKKTNLKKIFGLVARLRRKTELPILLMGYVNPILQYGYDRFARDARAAGVDGLIVPDVPPEEGGEIAPAMKKSGVDLVYLLAPTSDDARRAAVSRASRGFIYYVSMTGVTGSGRRAVLGEIRRNIALVKKKTKLPVCVGFGVSRPEQAAELARTADGVIIGSHIVRSIAENPKMSGAAFAAKYVRPFVRAVKGRR